MLPKYWIYPGNQAGRLWHNLAQLAQLAEHTADTYILYSPNEARRKQVFEAFLAMAHRLIPDAVLVVDHAEHTVSLHNGALLKFTVPIGG